MVTAGVPVGRGFIKMDHREVTRVAAFQGWGMELSGGSRKVVPFGVRFAGQQEVEAYVMKAAAAGNPVHLSALAWVNDFNLEKRVPGSRAYFHEDGGVVSKVLEGSTPAEQGAEGQEDLLAEEVVLSALLLQKSGVKDVELLFFSWDEAHAFMEAFNRFVEGKATVTATRGEPCRIPVRDLPTLNVFTTVISGVPYMRRDTRITRDADQDTI